jgi:hypothetical protein
MLSLFSLYLFSGVGPEDQWKKGDIFCSACGKLQSSPCLGPICCFDLFSCCWGDSSQKMGFFMRQAYWLTVSILPAPLSHAALHHSEFCSPQSHLFELRVQGLPAQPGSCFPTNLYFTPLPHITPAIYLLILLLLIPHLPVASKLSRWHSVTIFDFEGGGWFQKFISDSLGVSLLALGCREKYPIPLYEVSKGRRTVHYSRRVPLILPTLGLLFQLGVSGSWPQC